MKICVPASDVLRGPQIFCNRLFRALQEFPEVELVSPDLCEIYLHSAVIRDPRKSIKNILRLDGVYHHVGPEYNWKEKNKPIKKSYEIADGIVYQSQFSKRLCEKYLGTTNVPKTTIYNGADPKEYASAVVCRQFAEKPFFLAVANWRKFKRLRDIIESFLLIDSSDVDLVVVGDVSKSGITKNELETFCQHRKVLFTGKVDQDRITFFLCQDLCSALVHISWIDNCPNTVVEALCAGKPVICGNVGGTKEIVQKAGGIVLDLEEDYDLEPADLYHPAPIDRSLVAKAMLKCLEQKFNIQNQHVDIRNVAREYLEFFKSVLNLRR